MARNDISALTIRTGKHMRAVRLAQDLSQADFAKRLGISRGYLSDLERGVREMSLETAEVFCRFGGTTPNELFGWRQ